MSSSQSQPSGEPGPLPRPAPDAEPTGYDLDEMIAVLTGPAEIAAQTYPLIASAADRLTDALGAYEERTHAKH